MNVRVWTIGLILLFGAIFRPGAAQESMSVGDIPSHDDIVKEAMDALKEVTSTGRKSSLLRAPSTVTIITREEIRHSGARFLTDVLRLVPGIEVQRVSSTESAVSARGYNDSSAAAQGMMCLVDGRQVYHEYLGSVLWDLIPVSLDDIDRIEVIRGPGTFLYGPNAMHGLVNIVTRTARETGPVEKKGDEENPSRVQI